MNIGARLRKMNIYLDGKWEYPPICSEAADEIERLHLLNVKLVAALELLADSKTVYGDIARAALAKVKEGK